MHNVYSPRELTKFAGNSLILIIPPFSSVVKRKATMDVKVSDHITLAYKPNNRDFNKLNEFINKKVDVYVDHIRANKNIEAFWVSDMYLTESYKRLKRVDSGSPHITISHKKDFKPGDANTMFEKPISKQQRLGMLEGKIKWISFNNNKEKNDNRPIR